MTLTAMIGGYNEGLPIQIPMLDIQEVGTGGGSIARLDAGGALHVGPQSAGAEPGPVCYGLGGTRAHRDRREPRARPPRRRPLPRRRDAARRRSARGERLPSGVAEPLGPSRSTRPPTASCASPSRRCRTSVKRVTTERGLDAARLPAGRLRRRRAAARVAGRARAADPAGDRAERAGPLLGVRHAARGSAPRLRATLFVRLRRADFDAARAAFSASWRTQGGPRSCRARRESRAIAGRATRADMRYVGQEHAVTVDVPVDASPRARRAEHQAALRRGARAALRLRAPGRAGGDRQHPRLGDRRHAASPTLAAFARGGAAPAAGARTGARPVYFSGAGGWVDTPTFRPRRAARRATASPARR